MFLLKTIKQVKRFMTAVIGFTVLAIGLALTVLPGPAILVIPAGLAILSVEFAWARSLLNRMREKLSKKKGTELTPNTNGK